MESSQLAQFGATKLPPVSQVYPRKHHDDAVKGALLSSKVSYSADQLVLEKSFRSDDAAVVRLSSGAQLGLTISAEEIVAQLNEYLAEDLPEGLESLNPEDFTPEATANRIVDQIAGLFPAFRDQNPNLSDEEAVEEFITLANKGIEQGYNEAFDILDGMGAFQIGGVEESISKTLELLKERMADLEVKLRESLGLPEESELSNKIATDFKNSLLEQAALQSKGAPTSEDVPTAEQVVNKPTTQQREPLLENKPLHI
ncbi:MAG: DUF5610 domain-containing protein [Bdellovibrionales bacterium]|nr:DUF5610 domain-containing protein [Bdellovibrionales bacterium]